MDISIADVLIFRYEKSILENQKIQVIEWTLPFQGVFLRINKAKVNAEPCDKKYTFLYLEHQQKGCYIS